MKTIEQVLDNYKEFSDNFIEDRFGARFTDFCTEGQAARIGWGPKEGFEWPDPKEWTEENVIAQLKSDVEFGWEKACDERGISSSLMYEVCQAWCRVLENGFEDFDYYEPYGKPLFKAIAHKYGWELSDEYEEYYR